MSVADLVQPHALEIAREYLVTVSDATDLVGTRIMARTGDPLPARPYVRMDLAGGSRRNIRLWRVRIQFHVFGDTEQDKACMTAALTLAAALEHLQQNPFEGTDGIIHGSEIELLPILTWDESRTPATPDATFASALYVTPPS